MTNFLDHSKVLNKVSSLLSPEFCFLHGTPHGPVGDDTELAVRVWVYSLISCSATPQGIQEAISLCLISLVCKLGIALELTS